MTYVLKINGKSHKVEVDGETPLLWVLRDVLKMAGTKFGCGMALCGACTVHIDGAATRSCITTVDSVGEAAVTTIEAIGETPAGRKVQRAWLDHDVVQCGYCQSGQIMSAAALLASNPRPTESEINDAMSGNVCRCGTYNRIRAAIKYAREGGNNAANHRHAHAASIGRRRSKSLSQSAPEGRCDRGRGTRPGGCPAVLVHG